MTEKSHRKAIDSITEETLMIRLERRYSEDQISPDFSS